MELINISSRRYLGNKYKLLPFIKGVVDRECTKVHSFFDVFAGTGAVASAFTDCRLIVNDLMRSNYITALAWFSSEHFYENKVIEILNYFNSFDATKECNYFSDTFSDTYFSRPVCQKIGYIREAIDEFQNSGEINQREWAIILTSLFYSMDRIAATCGHYDSFIQGANLPEKINLRLPKIDYNLNSATL